MHEMVELDGTRFPLRHVLGGMRRLSGPEREVVCLRLGLGRRPCTLHEAAQQLWLTDERFRAIERLAAAKLRHPSMGGVGFAPRPMQWVS